DRAGGARPCITPDLTDSPIAAKKGTTVARLSRSYRGRARHRVQPHRVQPQVDWGILASTALGGGIAIAGSGLLAWRQDRRRRREEAARLAGAALAALRELDPEVWGDRLELRAPDESARVMAAASGRDGLKRSAGCTCSSRSIPIPGSPN